VRAKIASPRDALARRGDHNDRVDLASEAQQLLVEARRLFAGRDGRIALTLVLVLTATVEAVIYTPNVEGEFPLEAHGDPGVAILLNVLAVLPFVAAHRFPFLAAAGSSLMTFVLLAAPEAPVTLTTLGVLLYTVATVVVRRGFLFATPLVVPFLINAIAPAGGGNAGLSSVGPLLLVVAAVLIAESTRTRSEAIAALDATQEAMAESVREQTAMEERARIARELHDIVAHHLSVIAVQSETARLTSPKLSADARGRFEAIAATARDALTETRRLLGVLREDVGGEADRTPQPGLDQLGELIDTARDAGANIRLILQGKVVALPAGIDLAAYRILQEALTNARRHAPGADVDVEVAYGNDALQLRVRDYGPGPADGELAAGHGLVGMRDRASIAGGTFSSGSAEGGGFVVDVTLPIAEGSS
jgi:signal transduction histidine kinase